MTCSQCKQNGHNVRACNQVGGAINDEYQEEDERAMSTEVAEAIGEALFPRTVLKQ
jgi:hypothetical protein